MPRALWKGATSFGFIHVPVELHTTSKDGTLPPHMLESSDFAPMGNIESTRTPARRRIGGISSRAINARFVAPVNADFRHAHVKASETIQIDTFSDVEQIPPMYYEKPYYLAPAKCGDKAGVRGQRRSAESG
jgi:DNA end-binding protein Ku